MEHRITTRAQARERADRLLPFMRAWNPRTTRATAYGALAVMEGHPDWPTMSAGLTDGRAGKTPNATEMASAPDATEAASAPSKPSDVWDMPGLHPMVAAALRESGSDGLPVLVQAAAGYGKTFTVAAPLARGFLGRVTVHSRFPEICAHAHDGPGFRTVVEGIREVSSTDRPGTSQLLLEHARNAASCGALAVAVGGQEKIATAWARGHAVTADRTIGPAWEAWTRETWAAWARWVRHATERGQDRHMEAADGHWSSASGLEAIGRAAAGVEAAAACGALDGTAGTPPCDGLRQAVGEPDWEVGRTLLALDLHDAAGTRTDGTTRGTMRPRLVLMDDLGPAGLEVATGWRERAARSGVRIVATAQHVPDWVHADEWRVVRLPRR